MDLSKNLSRVTLKLHMVSLWMESSLYLKQLGLLVNLIWNKGLSCIRIKKERQAFRPLRQDFTSIINGRETLHNSWDLEFMKITRNSAHLPKLLALLCISPVITWGRAVGKMATCLSMETWFSMSPALIRANKKMSLIPLTHIREKWECLWGHFFMIKTLNCYRAIINMALGIRWPREQLPVKLHQTQIIGLQFDQLHKIKISLNILDTAIV
jgi:hypothetical protein